MPGSGRVWSPGEPSSVMHAKNGGLQLRSASFIPAELIAVAPLCLCQRHISWDRRWGASVFLYSLLAVNSEGFSCWTSLPEATSPLFSLPPLTNYRQVTGAHRFLVKPNASDCEFPWKIKNLHLTSHLAASSRFTAFCHWPSTNQVAFLTPSWKGFSRVTNYSSQMSSPRLYLHIERKHIKAFSFRLWVICGLNLSFRFQASLMSKEVRARLWASEICTCYFRIHILTYLPLRTDS